MRVWNDLVSRGLVAHSSDPEIPKILEASPVTFYTGYDPTADSLHVGSLVPLITQARLQRAGHRAIVVLGGATGMIGDPSGKSQERQILNATQIERNLVGLQTQIERVFKHAIGDKAWLLIDNLNWFEDVRFIDFLRDIGKHFSVNAMIAKESVRARLEEREQGISYTEFSYTLLQAYDFLHLFDIAGCTFQVGGSDQWGNITAGIDLIRRKRGQPAYGFTLPLITTSEGKKFGKTEHGNVWLDAERTSPFQFFQFFFNTNDRDVGRFLRYFTFLSMETIERLEESVRCEPEKRKAQQVLAREVTALVHGSVEAERAQMAAHDLFHRDLDGVEARLSSGGPTSLHPREDFENGMLLVRLLSDHRVGLCFSISDAARQIKQNGISLNGERVTDARRRVTLTDFGVNGKILLARGKKHFNICRIEPYLSHGGTGPERTESE